MKLEDIDTTFLLDNYDNKQELESYLKSMDDSSGEKEYVQKLLQKISFEEWLNIEPHDFDKNYEVKSLNDFTDDIIDTDVFDEVHMSFIADSKYYDTEWQELWDDLLIHENIKKMYQDYLQAEKIKWILMSQKNVDIVEKVFKISVLKKLNINDKFL